MVPSDLFVRLSTRPTVAHRGSRPPRRPTASVLMPFAAVLMGLIVGIQFLSVGSASAATESSSTGQYRVVGNRFVAPDGRRFIPYGFVVYCLAMKKLTCEHSTKRDPNTDLERIRVAATFWHADAIRIQVAPEHLFHRGVVDPSYISLLDREVELANKLGMVAIVTDQTEQFRGPPLPTSSAVRFWKYMAAHYAFNPRVFFDLYNEPRLKPTSGEHWMWKLWRNGGTATVKGVTDRFVGMQRLVNVIRRRDATNVIIAEGNQGDHDLSLVRHYLLSGNNVAYGIEPDLTTADQTPAEWAKNWGNLSDRLPIAMEAFQDWPSTSVCNPQSPRLLPQLLDYLRQKHLGLIVWSLEGGQVIVGANLRRPTTFQETAVYDCGSTTASSGVGGHGRLEIAGRHHHRRRARPRSVPTGPTPSNVGPGQDILRFFRGISESSVLSSSSRGGGWFGIGTLLIVAIGVVLMAGGGVVYARWRRSR